MAGSAAVAKPNLPVKRETAPEILGAVQSKGRLGFGLFRSFAHIDHVMKIGRQILAQLFAGQTKGNGRLKEARF